VVYRKENEVLMVHTKQDVARLENFLDAGQVAEKLGLSIATIRKWVLIRYIPYQKLGRAVRFSVPEIREWVKTRTVKPAEGQGTLDEAVTGNEGGNE
jgi:excisionase family DNA binding protein